MSITCALFGHRTLTDRDVTFNIGGCYFYLSVCVRCKSFVAKPANTKAQNMLNFPDIFKLREG